jgi:hypothetical protein
MLIVWVDVRKRFFSLALLIGLGWSMGSAQQSMRFSLRPDQLAISKCLAQPGSVPIPLVATNLNLEVADWATAAASTKQPGEFLLVFDEHGWGEAGGFG